MWIPLNRGCGPGRIRPGCARHGIGPASGTRDASRARRGADECVRPYTSPPAILDRTKSGDCLSVTKQAIYNQWFMSYRDFRHRGFWPLATFCKHGYAYFNFGVCEAMTRTSKGSVFGPAASNSGISPLKSSGPKSDSNPQFYLAAEPYSRNQPKSESRNGTQRAEPRRGKPTFIGVCFKRTWHLKADLHQGLKLRSLWTSGGMAESRALPEPVLARGNA